MLKVVDTNTIKIQHLIPNFTTQHKQVSVLWWNHVKQKKGQIIRIWSGIYSSLVNVGSSLAQEQQDYPYKREKWATKRQLMWRSEMLKGVQ